MQPTTAGQAVRLLRDRLYPLYGKRESDAMIRIIFEKLTGWSPVDLAVYPERELSPFVSESIGKIINRLEKHEPIQYILGDAHFYGMDLRVTPAVLIPRPETEQLVDMIADRYRERPDLRVLDIATGSGCIAIALSRNLLFPRVEAFDISPAAVDVARDNARRLHAQITFRVQDVFTWQPAAGSYDIIVSNPPYICDSEKKDMEVNVVDYEPHDALFVPDSEPLLFYSRIAGEAHKALSHGGGLYFEINPLHADALAAMLAKEGFTDVNLVKDSYGRTRFATATRP